ncbi:MAG: hypothetical protein JNL01_01505 [Bdellovibrionales bacterium]|nr:hypothetical protein [Bdellovibrionales bacterium]
MGIQLVLSFLLAIGSVHAQRVEIGEVVLTEADYSSIRTLSEKILKKFPEPNTVFVGIGRSPTPVIAYLQTSGHSALNLPLGGLNNLKPAQTANLSTLAFELEGHFNQFLGHKLQGSPPPKFVFIDYVSSGKSMGVASSVLESYFTKACPTCDFKFLAMGTDESIAGIQKMATAHQIKIRPEQIKSVSLTKDTNLSAVFEKFRGEVLDQAAEYEGYDISKNEKVMKNQGNGYTRLKEWMGKFRPAVKTTAVIKPATVCEATTASQARSAGGVLKPAVGMFSFALNVLSFFPTNNPFAKVIGVQCDSAKEKEGRVLCTGNSTVNPWTRDMVCTRATDIYVIDEKKNVCGVYYTVYEFTIPMSHLSSKFRRIGYFDDDGRKMTEKQFLDEIQDVFNVKDVQKYRDRSPPPTQFDGMWMDMV